MPGFLHFLRCVAKGIVRHGPRALASLVPMGVILYDAAGDILADYREDDGRQQQLRDEIQALAQANAAEVRQAAEEVVREVAADQVPEMQLALASYLRQVPATIRQSLRTPADLTGTTLPATRALRTPEDLLPFLPRRLPRFKPGDQPLPSVDWELVELLGVGGFGEVWKARHLTLDSRKPVALKFCLDAKAAEALRHEAQMLDRVMQHGRHPGIVPLLQTYLRADPPCLEYEYVAGGDLTGLMQDQAARGGASPAFATDIIHRLAKIIAFAHEHGIVHRDLKPANILVQRGEDGAEQLLVADFGIGGVAAAQMIRQETGQRSAREQTLPSAVRGAYTPLYASPQQRRGDRPDPRDDVHALGVMWHQFLAGDLTAERPGGRGWRKKLEGRGMAAGLIDLLESCIDDEADERPADAAELASRIEHLLKPSLPASPQPASSPALPKEIVNTLGMRLVRVPAGTFWMGERGSQTQVEISSDFYMDIYPVTQEQWETVMGSNPSCFARNSRDGGGADKVKAVTDADLKLFPVEWIKADEVSEFLNRLNEREKNSGFVYTIPTEAQWEYACRGGATSPEECAFDFYFAQPTNDLSSDLANFDGRDPAGRAPKGPLLGRTTKVGSYPPNRLGICDMHGNVLEWCQNRFPDGRWEWVFRGGSYENSGTDCRAANRNYYVWKSTPIAELLGKGIRTPNVGLRLVAGPSGGSRIDDEADERPAQATALAPLVEQHPEPTTATPSPANRAGTRANSAAAALPKEITNSLGMKLVRVPAGTFWMGERGSQTPVEIPQDFYMGIYPVTQEQWETVMGTNPGLAGKELRRIARSRSRWLAAHPRSRPDDLEGLSDADLKLCPVECVLWDEMEEFLKRLNEREKKSGFLYRLPTEAEWEYCCRGGATSQEECAFDFYFAQPTNDLSSDLANFNGRYPAGTAPQGTWLGHPTKVGSYPPNRLGIYDMHGNVWESCQDQSQTGGSVLVARGGSCGTSGTACRAANRSNHADFGCVEAIRVNNRVISPVGPAMVGLRLVAVPSEESCIADEAAERPAQSTAHAPRIEQLPEPAPPTPPQPTAPTRSQTPTAPASRKQIVNSLGMKLVFVPRGTFWMGERGSQRQVEIPGDFYMGIYPVTQEQWVTVMDSNPSFLTKVLRALLPSRLLPIFLRSNPSHFSRKGGGAKRVKAISDADLKQFPVECVSWNDVQKFLNRLNEREGGRGWLYRLPTEAEWEYSCRGGATSREECAFNFYFDQPTDDLSSQDANCDGRDPAGNAPKGDWLQRTTKVGSYKPNRLGIYDMHGNVWEWCQDSYRTDDDDSFRRLCGGNWHSTGHFSSAAHRANSKPGDWLDTKGFRLVAVPSEG